MLFVKLLIVKLLFVKLLFPKLLFPKLLFPSVMETLIQHVPYFADVFAPPFLALSRFVRLNLHIFGYKPSFTAVAIFLCGFAPYIILGSFYFMLDVLQIPFFEKRRLQPKPKCPRSAGEMLQLVTKILAVNVLAIAPTAEFLIAPIYEKIGISLFTPFPDWLTFFYQIVFCALVNDFLFYWMHRAFHHPSLYFLHKQHHKYTAPFAFASENADFVELFLLDLGPLFVGPLLLGSSIHLITVCIWVVLRVIYTCEIHSGYDLFFWRLIPFYGGAPMHDAHHQKFDGNYSDCFWIWDYLCGTYLPYEGLPQPTKK